MKQAIPDEARLALQRGDKIRAIKLTREATGLGLKEAKTLVEEAPSDTRSIALSDAPHGALLRGDLIGAVKALRREHPGMGLKEAKQIIDQRLADDPSLRQALDLRHAEGSSRFGWIVALVLLGGLLYYLLFA